MYKPRYKPDDLMLDYFDPVPVIAPRSAIPLARVERVSRCFYHLYVPGFMASERRRNVEAVDTRSVPLPHDFPWELSEACSALCDLGRIGIPTRLWCIYQLGHVYTRTFKECVDDFNGKTFFLPQECAFERVGYAVREIGTDCRNQWFWLDTVKEVLQTLRDRVGCWEEKSATFASILPNHLVEKGCVRWEAADLANLKAQLKPGDRICHEVGRAGIRFDVVERVTRSGNVIAQHWARVGREKLRVLPTAFPPEILCWGRSFSPYLTFAEVQIWALLGDVVDGLSKSLDSCFGDSLHSTSLEAIDAVAKGRVALYFTNDRIHWYLRLSDVLSQEIRRLNTTFPSGAPRVQ